MRASADHMQRLVSNGANGGAVRDVLSALLARHGGAARQQGPRHAASPIVDRARPVRPAIRELAHPTRAIADHAAGVALAERLLSGAEDEPSLGDPRTARDRVLVPAAEALGRAWLDDRATFVAVSAATERLSALLRGVAYPQGGKASLLLVPMPGDAHVFALELLADRLREDDWRVEIAPEVAGGDLSGLPARLRLSQATLVGLGCATPRLAPAAAGVIRRIRAAVPGIPVIAGGSGADEADEELRRAGVDAVCWGDPIAWLNEIHIAWCEGTPNPPRGFADEEGLRGRTA